MHTHTCIYTYIHTHIQTYIHTYIHTYIVLHTYIQTCIHIRTHPCTYIHTIIKRMAVWECVLVKEYTTSFSPLLFFDQTTLYFVGKPQCLYCKFHTRSLYRHTRSKINIITVIGVNLNYITHEIEYNNLHNPL